MISTPARRSSRWFSLSDVVVAVACFAGTLLAWALWMRWGVDLDVDYPVWRVAGLVLTLAAIGVPLAWWGWGRAVTVAIPPALAGSAYFDWEKTDDSGLFVLGVVYLFIGAGMVAVLVTSVVAALAARRPVDSDN